MTPSESAAGIKPIGDSDVGSIIRASGVFDPAWYLACHPDVSAAGMDPLDHYVRFGAIEGRRPNLYFDQAWYRSEYPRAAGDGLAALLHYIRHGEAEGRRPIRWFDPIWYRRTYAPPDDQLALAHFLAARDTGRVLPSAEMYAVSGLMAGQAGDRVAAFLDTAGPDASPDRMVLGSAGLVDENHYLLNASDVSDSGMAPLEHYCAFGWREGRQPNPYFDPDWYVRTNPDLARLGVNPLSHYVLEGEPRGSRPIPYFDPVWYRSSYAVPEGQTALAHFLAHRRSQTVSPTPLFDVVWYVDRFGQEIGRNRDPFAHFLRAATLGDVDPSPAFDSAAYRRRHLGRRSRGFVHLLRPERDNPLVHHLLATYIQASSLAGG